MYQRTMSSMKRSKSLPPMGRRSRTREPERDLSTSGTVAEQVVDGRGMLDAIEGAPTDSEHVEVGRQCDDVRRDGHFTSFFRALTGKDKKDKLRGRIHELERELETVKSENKIFSDGLDALRGALEQSPLSPCINLGPINVQVGHGSNKVIVVEEAKETIAKLTEMVEEVLANNAELQHSMERSELMLKENQQTLNEIKETVCNKPKTKLDVERVEKLIADALDNRTDNQMFLDGIHALLECANHNRMVADFESMPGQSRRAISRLVNKYEAVMGAEQFAKELGVAITASLQTLIKDASVPLDKYVCAKVVLEWTKNADNTSEKFVVIIAGLDQMIVKEKTAALRKELLQKKQRASVASDESFEGHVTPSMRSAQGSRSSNESMQMQNQRTLMAHMVEISKYLLEVHENVRGLPQFMDDLLARNTKVEPSVGSMSFGESPKQNLFETNKTISFCD